MAEKDTTPGDEDRKDHTAVGIGVVGGTPIGESTHAAEAAAKEQGAAGASEEGDTDEVSSILAQVRADAADASRDEVESVLRERLGQAGIDVPDDEIAQLTDQVTTGDA